MRPNHGLQPTRLSRLDFETGFAIVGGSEQKGALQTRLAAEPCPLVRQAKLDASEGVKVPFG